MKSLLLLQPRTLFLTLGICAFLTEAPAQQPWNVDAPSTAREGFFTVRLAYLSSETASRKVQSTPRLQVSYGLTPQTEGMLRVTHLSVIRNQASAQGLGDTVVGVKHRFYEDAQNHVALSYQVSIPTGDSARGLGSDQLEHQVLLLAQHRLNSRETILANVGERITAGEPGAPSAIFGLLYKNQLNTKTTVGIQLFGNKPFKHHVRDDLSWGVGAIHRFAPDRALLVQGGRSLKGNSKLNLYVGLQMSIPSR